MKKLLFILAIGAFAACADTSTESDTTSDTSSTMQSDTSSMTPTDTSSMPTTPTDTAR